MKILVTGTSHLIPRNQAWKALTSNHEVIFAEQNEWSDLFVRENSRLREAEAVAWIIALEDIVDPQANENDVRETLALLLGPLRAALARMPRMKFVVAWSFPLSAAPILYARRGRLFWDAIALDLEKTLREIQVAHNSLFLLPLNRAFAGVGWNACFDSRNYYAGNCRYSFRGLQIIAESIGVILNRTQKAAAKVLALDCDNTLWGGVVGEDGLDGIVLGQDGAGRAFQDFQRAAKRLATDGILLALASKNNETDVWQVFEKHPGMILKRNDIIATSINWNEKSAGLAGIAEELGLGLESLVFWDDNPLERERVRNACPQATVPEIPRDVSEWSALLAGLSAFHSFETTAEDRKKLVQYQARGQFQVGLRSAPDESQFLRSLELRPQPAAMDNGLLGRAEQLCAKTNQFNLRTQRHSAADLKRLSENPRSVIFLTHLRDRFGDHGNVGLVIARLSEDGRSAFLDTFLMSCRVLGRHLEAWMLHHCVGQLRQRGCEQLIAEFIPSERNTPAKAFLSGHGFITVSDGEREALRHRFAGIQPGGELYSARLDGMQIPHLDIYDAKT